MAIATTSRILFFVAIVAKELICQVIGTHDVFGAIGRMNEVTVRLANTALVIRHRLVTPIGTDGVSLLVSGVPQNRDRETYYAVSYCVAAATRAMALMCMVGVSELE